jgi:hypothetical protein
MAYLKREQRFALVANRFDWASADAAQRERGKVFARRRSGLRFERVRGARVLGLDLKKQNAFLVLLAMTFMPKGGDEPGGAITLTFSGGAAIELDVEVLEAEMKDLGGAWTTRRKPAHDEPPEG